MSHGRDEVHDQRVDFPQVFAAAFFRLQLTIANDDREIADFVEQFSRELFDRPMGPERGDADEKIIFETADVCLGNGPQIAVQCVKFRFKHRKR